MIQSIDTRVDDTAGNIYCEFLLHRSTDLSVTTVTTHGIGI